MLSTALGRAPIIDHLPPSPSPRSPQIRDLISTRWFVFSSARPPARLSLPPPEGAAVGEERGLANLRESHRRADRRDHRRVPDVRHGAVAAGE